LNALNTFQRDVSLNETESRAFLHKYLFSSDEVFTPVRSLSYGQRARLALACMVAKGCNFLLLDEPLNHLDLPSRAQFEQALSTFEGTILTVVHDRYFIQRYATCLWEIRNEKVIIL
jgi:ATP-binding cassette, subfamily F, member 3